MPTFTLKASQVDALLFAVEKTRVKHSSDLDEALERIHDALDNRQQEPNFVLAVYGVDGSVRHAENFRRKASKHLDLDTRITAKADDEAARRLSPGEALVVARGTFPVTRGTIDFSEVTVQASTVVERRGSDTLLDSVLIVPKAKAAPKAKPAAKKVATKKAAPKAPAKVAVVKAEPVATEAPAEEAVSA